MSTRARLRRSGLALLGFAVVLLFVAWPLLAGPSRLVPLGGPLPDWAPGEGDPWNFLWRIDWLWRHPSSILEATPRTPDLFAPFGVELTMLRGLALQGLLALGLRPLGDLVLAHNVIWALSFLLTALATAALAGEVSGSRPGAFVAGVFVAFGPPFYLHSLQHSYKYVAFGLVPLALLGLWRYLDHGRGRDLGLLAVAAAGILVSDWYNALFVTIAALVLLGARVGTDPARVLGHRLLTMALLALPLAAILAWAVAPVAATRAGTLVADIDEQARYSVDLVSLGLPPSTHPLWGKAAARRWARLPGNEIEKTAFLGWVLPILLAAAAWRRRDDRRVRIWGLVAAVFLLLAFGPWLQWDGERLLRLPGYWLGQVPGLAGSRAPGRYAIMAHLAVAIVMAVVIGRQRHPARAAAAGLALMALELAPFATPVAELRRPPALAALAGEEGGTVLDVPYRFHSGLYTALQTQHRRPLVGGYLIRITARYSGYPQGVPGFELFADPLGAPLPRDPERLHATLARLLDVRWIVLHKDLVADAGAAAHRLAAAGLPVTPWREDESTIVLRLSDAPAPASEARWRYADARSTAALVGLGWDADPAGHLWGSDAPRLALDPPAGAQRLSLELLAYRARVTGEPEEVHLTSEGLSERRTLSGRWEEIEVPAPARRDSLWLLTLSVEDPARPADLEPPSQDRRCLSVALRSLRWSE